MISYKLINGKFEIQKELIAARFSFDNQISSPELGNETLGGYNSLRDISPLRDGLAVITTKQGLSVIRAKDAKLTANTLTLQEMQDQIETTEPGPPFQYSTYEVAETSQLHTLGDIFSSQILQKGILMYNYPDKNLISVSSLETGLKMIEAISYNPPA
jgi:hypothetical protein